MTTLSLDLSRKICELCGEVETEKCWTVEFPDNLAAFGPLDVRGWEQPQLNQWKEIIPAPNFAETIRLLVLIGEKKKWWVEDGYRVSATAHASMLSELYMHADTEEAGMKACEEYLGKLL